MEALTHWEKWIENRQVGGEEGQGDGWGEEVWLDCNMKLKLIN